MIDVFVIPNDSLNTTSYPLGLRNIFFLPFFDTLTYILIWAWQRFIESKQAKKTLASKVNSIKIRIWFYVRTKNLLKITKEPVTMAKKEDTDRTFWVGRLKIVGRKKLDHFQRVLQNVQIEGWHSENVLMIEFFCCCSFCRLVWEIWWWWWCHRFLKWTSLE